MAIFNIFGKKDVSDDITKNVPYRLVTEWVPYKMYSGRKSTTTLKVKLKNMTKEVLLTSLVVELPNKLGFDEIGMSKQREIRMGELAPDEEKEVGLSVYNGTDADPGEYTVSLAAIAHYRDYGHIINAIKKRTTVQVV
jgi:uncharacterized membrane protein